MSNLNPSPSGLTPAPAAAADNGSSSSSRMPQYSWIPAPPLNLASQIQRPQPPAFDGYGSSLASPLGGLPPHPPTQPLTPIQQNLSAGQVPFPQHVPPQYSSTPITDRFLAFTRSVYNPYPGTPDPPSRPQQTLSQEQYLPPHQLPIPHWTNQGQNTSNYIPYPLQQRQNLEDALRKNPVRIATPPLEHGSAAREVVTESINAPVETRVVLPEPVERDSTATRVPRKRGRPRQLDAEGQPKKRRKKGTGRPGGWSKGLKMGPRPAIDPGVEFNQFYTQATEAFIDDQDNDKALDLILKAIALNPEIYSAHALLSEIYFAQDQDEKAIAALFGGAHATPTDPEVWFQAANACLERYKGSHETALQQASYCFSRIIHVPSARDRHPEARFKRAAINRELANYSKAMKDLEIILEQMPRNSDVLRQMAEICIDTKDLTTARQVYEDTLTFYKEKGFDDEESFTWADVLVYAQILALEEPPELATCNALRVLKQLSRWLLDRDDEAYWDEVIEDDREFDSEDEPRRVLVSDFVPGRYQPDAYGAGLPLEIRVRMGMLRLRQGPEALDEALAHFEWLEPEARDEGASVYEYPDLFLEVGQGFLDIKEYDQALRYFEALKEINAYSHVEFWLDAGATFYMCGDKLQAFECYEEARAEDEQSVDARMHLSKLYADFGDKESAMENARDAVRLADGQLPETGKRKYEPKELRLIREEAEKTLKEAFQLPGRYTGGTPVERIESKLVMARRGKSTKRKPRQYPTKEGLARDQDNEQQLEDDMEYFEDLSAGLEHENTKRIVQEVAARRKDRPPGRPQPKPVYRVKRMTPKETEARRTETSNRLYQNLINSSEAMRNGDEIAQNTWMDCADSLISDFRSNRALYVSSRARTIRNVAREELQESRKRDSEAHEMDPAEEEVDQDFPIPSIESSQPLEFREIALSDWLDIFLEYALLLSASPDTDSQHRCYVLIDAALDCVAWKHDSRSLLQINTVYLACALAFKDADTLFNIVLRWFIKTYRFNDDAYRLFAAVSLVYSPTLDKTGREGQVKNAMFRGRPVKQQLFKQLIQMGQELPMDYSPKEYGPVPEFMRSAGGGIRQGARGNEDDLEGTPASENVRGSQDNAPTPEPAEKDDQQEEQTSSLLPDRAHNIREMNALLLVLYAQILQGADNSISALSYFFRAQSLAPQNPVILLSIALCYMHEVVKKFCDNRHMHLLQAWAFFEEYADARRAWAKGREQQEEEGEATAAELGQGLVLQVEREIEFNRARSWHMLGMLDLAVRSYQKMLSLGTWSGQPVATSALENEKGTTDFTMEAAYAISTMYALSGNPDMAREVTEKYLVV